MFSTVGISLSTVGGVQCCGENIVQQANKTGDQPCSSFVSMKLQLFLNSACEKEKFNSTVRFSNLMQRPLLACDSHGNKTCFEGRRDANPLILGKI